MSTGKIIALIKALGGGGGAPGPKGDKGEQGIQGEPGLKGDKGDKGEHGPINFTRIHIQPEWWNSGIHLDFNYWVHFSREEVTHDTLLELVLDERGLNAAQIKEQKKIISTIHTYAQEGGFGFRIVDKPTITLTVILKGA